MDYLVKVGDNLLSGNGQEGRLHRGCKVIHYDSLDEYLATGRKLIISN